jgi:glutamate N-acetyltransferase/amino-acid N-acetyltransferase
VSEALSLIEKLVNFSGEENNMVNYISPFASEFPPMPAIPGVRLATACSGMKYEGRDDLFMVTFPENTIVAGCLTKNLMPGEPIKWCRAILPNGKARALVVNAGYANVWTGAQGYSVVENTAQKAAEIIGCKPEEVYISSTGVIGEQVVENALLDSLPKLYENLGDMNFAAAAKAFMTTDTFPKGVTKTTKIGDTEITLNAIIKGSGMIAPNMATTLSYIFTDAKIPANILQELMNEAVDVSLNCATVDGDTSTSDTCLVFATGQTQHDAVTSLNHSLFEQFRKDFKNLMKDLAKLLVKDGEGLTKFVTINIKNASSQESARKIGLSIANSPLVKTAIAAEDPNWGRVVAAIGKAGEPVDEGIDMWIGDSMVAINGSLNPNYVEAEAALYMKNPEISITVDVDSGNSAATVWTCDLTHDYISINADYRS